MSVASIAKGLVIRGLVLALSLFYGWCSIVAGLIRWVMRGNQYWQVKERNLPPKCLQDSVYGRHAYMKLKDIKLHYVENGDRSKPLMLFLHGFPEFWFSWRHQMKYFAKTHWCVAIDMRGYGDSDKPTKVSDYDMPKLIQDVTDMIKALGREKCILVAHDWGGGVAWQVAIWQPAFVEKLVIANSPHPADFGEKISTSVGQFFKSWYIFFFKLPYLPERTMFTDDLAIFDKMLLDAEGKPMVTKDELEAYKYAYARKGSWTAPVNYYRANLDFISMLNQPAYPKISVPTLIIWGEKDIALSKDFPERARQHITDLHIHYIPEATHFVQEDKPGEFNAALASFINKK